MPGSNIPYGVEQQRRGYAGVLLEQEVHKSLLEQVHAETEPQVQTGCSMLLRTCESVAAAAVATAPFAAAAVASSSFAAADAAAAAALSAVSAPVAVCLLGLQRCPILGPGLPRAQ